MLDAAAAGATDATAGWLVGRLWHCVTLAHSKLCPAATTIRVGGVSLSCAR